MFKYRFQILLNRFQGGGEEDSEPRPLGACHGYLLVTAEDHARARLHEEHHLSTAEQHLDEENLQGTAAALPRE